MTYDPQAVEAFFDSFGSGEYERHDTSPEQRMKYELHVDCLRAFVPEGSRVLEIGPGPGRFTEILAGMGCRITIVEISAEQLRLHQRRAQEEGYASSVEAWHKADMCDLEVLAEERFDSVVAFGGPFSYVLDRRNDALLECLKLLDTDGSLLVSVMSKWGTIHAFLHAIYDISEEELEVVTRTGDVTAETSPSSVAGGHFFHMFTAEELERFFSDHGLRVEFMSASNAISTTWGELLEQEAHFARVLGLEREAVRASGARDMGTHLLAVARRPGARSTGPEG